MKTLDKLRVYWSKKEKDIEFYYPLGNQTGCDARYLNNFFNQDFIDEIKKRGYDITTLKFEISPLLPNEDKFPSLSKDHA